MDITERLTWRMNGRFTRAAIARCVAESALALAATSKPPEIRRTRDEIDLLVTDLLSSLTPVDSPRLDA